MCAIMEKNDLHFAIIGSILCTILRNFCFKPPLSFNTAVIDVSLHILKCGALLRFGLVVLLCRWSQYRLCSDRNGFLPRYCRV